MGIRVSPNYGVPFLGVIIVRIIVCWGLYWGPPIQGNYQVVGSGLCSHSGRAKEAFGN